MPVQRRQKHRNHDHQPLTTQPIGCFLIDLEFEIELTGFEMPEIDLILEDARQATGEASGPEDRVPQCPSGPVVTQTEICGCWGATVCCAQRPATRPPMITCSKAPKRSSCSRTRRTTSQIDGNVCGLGHICHREFAMGSGEIPTYAANPCRSDESIHQRYARRTAQTPLPGMP